jgi:diguanylate cyclase (GGDEF)-like protein/PAS domain S-box-containing protein
MQANRNISAQDQFPLRLFAAAFTISLLATVLGAWLLWEFHVRLDDLRTRQFRLSQHISRIMLFDEVLTMSARMAVATGDAAYKARYDKFDAELNNVLTETKQLVRQPEEQRFIKQIDEANRKLVEIERRALALAIAGRQAEASQLLAADEYSKWKQVYADNVAKVVAWERETVKSEEQTLRFLIIIFLISSGAIVVAIISTWYFALAAARRWAEERLSSEAALRRARDELEQRVAERTAQLRSATEVLQQRDALLRAVSIGATEIGTAASLEQAIQKSLELISKATRIDRIVLLERLPHRTQVPVLRYLWENPALTCKFEESFFDDPRLESADILAWAKPITEGRTLVTNVRSVTGEVRRMFERVGVKTNLIVPIMVDGKPWGQIAFDTCVEERTWTDFEIETLHTLGELIATAIQRDRYVKELSAANRIVLNTPTILYRLRGEPTFPLIYISQNIKLFGYEPALLTAAPVLLQNLVHPDDRRSVHESLTAVLDKDGSSGITEFRLLTGRGDYRWVENRYSPIRDASGRLLEIEGLLFDITERKAAEEKIARLARVDALTGLANRATFMERLRQSFAATRRGAAPFAVLYLDLDRFKDINDTMGHTLGDRFLVIIAERLKKSIRETDIAARLGGDEFGVLLNNLTDASDAGALAAKMRAALAQPVDIGGSKLSITASIGISICTHDTATPEDLLAQADIALYRAKEEGRDQYRFHTEELDSEVRERAAIAEELRAAVTRGEFTLHYQPQVELSSGQIVGMEALIRWNHPKRGLLMPSDFIPVAEKTDAIVAIGRWVLDQACRQMHEWRKSGLALPTLAVNISPAQIKAASEFIQFVIDTLAKWQLASSDLELDVTESMLARATLAQNDVLERLHKLGVKISIDDFGTKYSTLDYLRTYRVNRLKIPQVLVDAATRDPESAAMVRAIIGIARELQIEVVAQGVETEAQWAFLTAASPVSKVQGFYYSKPVPAECAGALLRRGRIVPAIGRAAAAEEVPC